jgi:hypothetical protein
MRSLARPPTATNIPPNKRVCYLCSDAALKNQAYNALQIIPNPFKDVHSVSSEKRKAGKRKESCSALPKAKENLINRIWYNAENKTEERDG